MKSKPRAIFLNKQKIRLKKKFDKSIFEGITWSRDILFTHHDVCQHLKDKNPYTITIVVENLKQEYWNRKEYVKKTRNIIGSRYRQLLYDYFFKEYGQIEGNNIYGQWLEKYRPQYEKEKKYECVDEYIVKYQLEPRYGDRILKRFKNHEKLFKKRVEIKRDRYYNLPEPLNYIDWRNPYDNLFVWEENGQKVANRGGSGSSGGRERNSLFIYGLLELSKLQSVPSYLFIYSEENTLLFLTKFQDLCVPYADIGENYQISYEEDKKLKKSRRFFNWSNYSKVWSITAISR